MQLASDPTSRVAVIVSPMASPLVPLLAVAAIAAIAIHRGGNTGSGTVVWKGYFYETFPYEGTGKAQVLRYGPNQFHLRHWGAVDGKEQWLYTDYFGVAAAGSFEWDTLTMSPSIEAAKAYAQSMVGGESEFQLSDAPFPAP